MFIVNPWLVIAPALALMTWIYAKRRSSRNIIKGSVIFLALAYAALLWTPSHFAEMGCSGDMSTGIICPEGRLLTKFALLHEVFMLLGRIYFFLALPVVFVGIYLSERYEKN